MIAFRRTMKCGLATVLVTLASPDHQSKGSSTMADASIAPVLIQAKVARSLNSSRHYLHLCICVDCKKERLLPTSRLNRVRCSACVAKFTGQRRSGVDPKTRSKIQAVHSNMIQRCTNPKYSQYAFYGGRGIAVCPEWRSVSTFRKWLLDNGWSPSLQIDRIDNDKGYSPENCRLVTCSQNCRNRRSTRLNPDLVRAIRMLRWSGIPEKDVAMIFGVNRKQVNEIMRFVLWGDV